MYDDFKLKKNLWSPWSVHKYFGVEMIKCDRHRITCNARVCKLSSPQFLPKTVFLVVLDRRVYQIVVI